LLSLLFGLQVSYGGSEYLWILAQQPNCRIAWAAKERTHPTGSVAMIYGQAFSAGSVAADGAPSALFCQHPVVLSDSHAIISFTLAVSTAVIAM